MSPRSTLSIAAALAVAALPAPALAKKPAKVANEPASIVAPNTALGQVRPSHAKLGPAHRVDIGAMRHLTTAKRSARKHHRTVLPAGKSVAAKLLILAPNATDPAYAWWTTALKTEGVPFDAIVTSGTAVTTSLLQSDATHGNYEGVILTSGSLIDWSSGSAVDTMTKDEWAALQAYEASFAVRELNAYDYPQPMFGTGWGGNCSDKSGTTATVTAAGASIFSDLAGSFPIDNGVYGCESTPLADSAWQTLISGANGAMVGTTIRTDGVETMFDSYSGADWTIYTRLLVHGMLNWVTKGVYLGMHRDYFRVDVDDVFLANDRWDPATHAINPDETTNIRMTPNDVLRAAQWEQKNGIQFNFLFNGDGADPTGDNTSSTGTAATARTVGAPPKQTKSTSTTTTTTTTTTKAPAPKKAKPVAKPPKAPKKVADSLTNALLLMKDQFRWTNHTFTHPEFLNTDTLATLQGEIQQNIDFGRKYKLPFDPTELVTGGHTGLTNPNMPQALANTGVKWFGEDNSIHPTQYGLGNASSVPRWPTGVYYNVGTFAEELDEYNYLNYTICGDGQGHGIGCLPAPVTSYDQFVNNETGMILRHILDNNPRPHFVHQSNLAEDGTFYPVGDEVLKRFHAYLNTPLVQLTETQEGQVLQQQAAWNAAVANGQVTGTITGGQLTVTSSVPNLAVPATGVTAGTLYGGTRSGWFPAGNGQLNLGL
jgi:hypothetical protein